ncbi:3-dehydro-L-gulonate-6-phosphate decarboxylase [Silvimonas terrae]|uniref:3-dehydro-L-gulonate-6-phosphate decarboxylase n=1 Tax=Silvimonas terrae TaxID=300266 RepID=A0A840RIN1_9NEIS|nr:3-keto-L-gulonate-6-phosphate decarboxylase UlaD [Silvimonas terrae]MBB5193559.1 3-dehydro-L-gulonate-6-phosphate decarboxylase [Silvimonas terrae]
MTQPQLQVALDQLALAEALQSLTLLAPHIDIIEAGTLLCCSVGMQAVRTLREAYPQHTLVADLKAADAGETMTRLAMDAGADWTTVICAAPLATIEKAHETAEEYGGEIQIELFGHWTLNDARDWQRIGIRQAIYHRGRDAQAKGQGWSATDLDLLRALADIGIAPSVTGGLDAQDLALFKGIPVRAFIAGRALYGAPEPAAAAQAFRQQIRQYWGQ